MSASNTSLHNYEKLTLKTLSSKSIAFVKIKVLLMELENLIMKISKIQANRYVLKKKNRCLISLQLKHVCLVFFLT